MLHKFLLKINNQCIKSHEFSFQEETEWQHFLRCNIECLAKIADISPIPIFTLLVISKFLGRISYRYNENICNIGF